jgi:hypothetical protein
VAARPRATSDWSSVWVWLAIGHAYGIAPNSGAAWLPAHGLAGSGGLPFASHQAFGPPVVVLICHA